jgi:RDD family
MSRGQARAKPALPRPAGDPLASISRRSLAWIIDVVLVTVLIFIGVSLLDAAFGPAVRFEPDAATLSDTVAADMGMVVLNALLGTGLSAAYFVVPWALMGGSPAQLALRMRVRSDTDCEALPVWRAIARWILLFPPFATVSALTAGVPLLGWVVWGSALLWYLLLLVTIAQSETNQGLHDRIAHSVVRKRRAVAG